MPKHLIEVDEWEFGSRVFSRKSMIRLDKIFACLPDEVRLNNQVVECTLVRFSTDSSDSIIALEPYFQFIKRWDDAIEGSKN